MLITYPLHMRYGVNTAGEASVEALICRLVAEALRSLRDDDEDGKSDLIHRCLTRLYSSC